ncbi:MAG: thiamine-monophosphate kinase [Verrucomicrobia bacterium]|nr:MAG: thiamine-monophosphate kinase [Verrucomicrobiota bacterium]
MSPFSDVPVETIAALGEQKLLTRVRRWLGSTMPPAPRGMGDDCAVLPHSPASTRGRSLLVTVDPVIYGQHFDHTVPARAAGQKLLSRNLSDIAAMGGRPTAAVLALALDPRTRIDWLEGFYRGLAATARRHGVAVVGGDLATHHGGLVASLTLLGETTTRRALTRAGAAEDDFIAVTGVLGGSLTSGHHWRFTPRLAEGAWLAARREVTAMMDVSDGLAKDLHALAPAKTKPLLFDELIPRRAGCDLSAALTDGEDYELLFTVRGTPAVARRFTAAWAKAFPRTPITVIGRFVADSFPADGALNLAAYHGFEHFR